MKVLFLVSYITISGEKDFTKNITGYGLMVQDIADYVSREGVEVDVLGSSLITKGKIFQHFHILHRTWVDIVLNIRLYYLLKFFRFVKGFRPSFKHSIKILYYFLSVGYVEEVLRLGKYDLVHIHGIGSYAKAYIECCERIGIRYLVTLHGLNSFSEIIHLEKSEKQYEKFFLHQAYKNAIPITIISTGLLNAIKKFLNVYVDIPHFHVITNGTEITRKDEHVVDIRQKYSISSNRNIMLSVSNICGHKNQTQIVRAYALLPDEVKGKLSIFFLGTDTTGGNLQRQIDALGLTDNLIMCGNIDRDELSSYYQQADFTILASIAEGFGLSIIEGFVFGLPNLTYSDLNAIPDLFDQKVMLALTNRSDTSLATGITLMLSTHWDREYIKGYAMRFSLECMAKKYIQAYQKVTEYQNEIHEVY